MKRRVLSVPSIVSATVWGCMYSARAFSEARNHSLYLILKEPVKPGLKTKESLCVKCTDSNVLANFLKSLFSKSWFWFNELISLILQPTLGERKPGKLHWLSKSQGYPLVIPTPAIITLWVPAELLPAFPSASVGTHYVSNRHVGRLTVLAYEKALYREFNRQGGFRLARKFTSYKAK